MHSLSVICAGGITLDIAPWSASSNFEESLFSKKSFVRSGAWLLYVEELRCAQSQCYMLREILLEIAHGVPLQILKKICFPKKVLYVQGHGFCT